MASCASAFAQNANDIVNIFGGLIKSAKQQSTLPEWKKLPISELDCLARHFGVPVLEGKIKQGATVNDPDIQLARAACRSIANQSETPRPQRLPSVAYVVDGIALGGQLKFESEAYRSYSCKPSEQFSGFTWCQKKRDERDPRGQYSSSYSILHTADGVALYINRYLEPAWFSGNEANDDINGRSKKYGAPSRIIPMPQQSSVPNGMIVTWGNVVLEPLNSNGVSELAAGRDIRFGLIIDHIGNLQRSAQQGLPIYRLTGGGGYVWAASWNQNGIGTLRFLAVDALAIASASQGQPQCIVRDPTGTPLNVRSDPNGRVTDALPNGTVISVIDRKVDRNKKPWVYVSDRTGRRLGWVFRDFITCSETPASVPPPDATFADQESIRMEREGGVYVVAVRFNDMITLNSIVDSGASDMSIPADIVSTLIRTKTITEQDFLGKQTYTLADGSKVPSQQFRIRSLKVGNRTIENVAASIGSVNGEILLGQSFLSRFRSWSIDNEKHTLILK